MRDLSMSILDLAMNSIRAHATVIEIKVAETLEWNEQLILFLQRRVIIE